MDEIIGYVILRILSKVLTVHLNGFGYLTLTRLDELCRRLKDTKLCSDLVNHQEHQRLPE